MPGGGSSDRDERPGLHVLSRRLNGPNSRDSLVGPPAVAIGATAIPDRNLRLIPFRDWLRCLGGERGSPPRHLRRGGNDTARSVWRPRGTPDEVSRRSHCRRVVHQLPGKGVAGAPPGGKPNDIIARVMVTSWPGVTVVPMFSIKTGPRPSKTRILKSVPGNVPPALSVTVNANESARLSEPSCG
jgi:hypothetical protein